MQIKLILIEGFRSLRHVELHLDPSPIVLVGENNTGKTTVLQALQRLAQQMTTGSDMVLGEDYPYARRGALRIQADIELSPEEFTESIVSPLEAHDEDPQRQATWRDWCEERGHSVRARIERPGINEVSLQWGEVRSDRGASFAVISPHGMPNDREQVVHRASGELRAALVHTFTDRFKLSPEFRTRVDPSAASTATGSFTGAETANALFNLRTHTEVRQRRRYDEIIQAFLRIYPRYQTCGEMSRPC